MFYQNDQIHNNLYLIVGNSNEIGKVYQGNGKVGGGLNSADKILDR
jgi:hypothetical protein